MDTEPLPNHLQSLILLAHHHHICTGHCENDCPHHSKRGFVSVTWKIDIPVLNLHFFRSNNLISLAAASGDNETQKHIFELILLCYADGNFDCKTRMLIARYFGAVNFETIDSMLLSCYREDMTKEQIKKVWLISTVELRR